MTLSGTIIELPAYPQNAYPPITVIEEFPPHKIVALQWQNANSSIKVTLSGIAMVIRLLQSLKV